MYQYSIKNKQLDPVNMGFLNCVFLALFLAIVAPARAHQINAETVE